MKVLFVGDVVSDAGRKMLLSIVGGTAVYILLVNLVFV